MENFIINMLNDFKMNINAAALIQIGIILVLTVAAIIVLHIVSKKIRAKLEDKGDIRKIYAVKIIFRVARIIVVLTGVIAILQAAGINLVGLSASFGLVILLIALAVKDALQDVFAGAAIMSDKYFNVGDAVEFDGHEGIVLSLTARSTKIELLDDRSILSVANRNVSKIRKLTHLVDVDLPLSYDLTGNEAFSVLEPICESIRKIEGVERCELKGTQSFDASAIIYKIRFFCDPMNRPDIRRAVLKTIQDGLEAAGVRIPYQQIDIHT